jgi:hypothetical protein
MENNKAFTLTNDGKTSFFTITGGFCQLILNIERTKKTSLLVEFKGMLRLHFFQVRNYMMWYRSMVTLYLVFNQVNRSFLLLV